MNQMHCFQNFFESAYSRSMSTTKIILIISSSTKILYLEDILLKCLPKKIKHLSSKHREMLDGDKVGHCFLMISAVVVK